MHVDEFIFNCCVSSMISDDIPDAPEECAMNVFSIDENKIRDANGIIFAEAITCYKCTFCGKMFAAMEVVLTHYQSNHRCSVIPLLKGMTMISTPMRKTQKTKLSDSAYNYNGRKGRPSKSPNTSKTSSTNIKVQLKTNQTSNQKISDKSELRNTRSNTLSESPALKKLRLLRESTENKNKLPVKLVYKKGSQKSFKCRYPGCEKKFSYHNSLLSHRKTHIKLKSYKCDWNECEFTCSDSAGLEFHKQTHSGDNPYKCSWPGCDQSFADPSAKDQHLQKQHIGDRTLQCDYPGCIAKFMLSSDREKHKAIHLGKKISAPVPVTRRPLQLVSDSDSDSGDNEKDDDDDEEEEEDIEEENSEDLKSKIDSEVKDKKDEVKNEPLDLSKNNDLNKEEMKAETKSTPKSKKQDSSKTPTKSISNKVFRCDYPGCRKTFPNSSDLKEHEKDTHKTPSAEGRSRYERRCKGNLYYKI